MAIIYHITTRASWDQGQKNGEYRAESLESQGFIHFSKADQVARVATAVFAGQSGLVLLHVDTDLLRAELKYEPPDTTVPAAHIADETFPHLYGALNLDAVVQVADFSA